MIQTKKFFFIPAIVVSVIFSGTLISFAEKKTVRVFLLSGQSNMTGRGSLGRVDQPVAEQKGTLLHYIKQPANEKKLSFLINGSKKTKSGWTIRDDVFITMGDWPHLREGEEGYNAYNKHGGLSAHYGSRGNRGFGPEFAIGHMLGDHYEDPVVLVKVAFGGNSLAGNFRPPSSGGKLGDKYPLVVKALREALQKIPEMVEGVGENPEIKLEGFFWNQGLSDASPKVADEYETNMVNLIKDIRKEFKAPDLKVVIGVTGNWGWKPDENLEKWGNGEEDRQKFIKSLKTVQDAQLNVAKLPGFKGTVSTAETRDFWRPRAEFGGRGTETHWMANGESYWLIGDSMGQAMLDLLKSS
tara:strand:- start:11074 stop:12138 length:1065 start_codon:yes stop_codon:yes gene_type:complete